MSFDATPCGPARAGIRTRVDDLVRSTAAITAKNDRALIPNAHP